MGKASKKTLKRCTLFFRFSKDGQNGRHGEQGEECVPRCLAEGQDWPTVPLIQVQRLIYIIFIYIYTCQKQLVLYYSTSCLGYPFPTVRFWSNEVGLVYPWECAWVSWRLRGETSIQTRLFCPGLLDKPIALWKANGEAEKAWAWKSHHTHMCCTLKAPKTSCVFRVCEAWTMANSLFRTRVYRIFYQSTKYEWKGPPMRQLLKLLLPLQKLNMDADDMYFMTKDEVATRLQWVQHT